MKIFEVMAKYQQLLDKEELTHEDETDLINHKGNIEEFAIHIAAYIKNMEAEYDQILEAISRMDARCIKLEKQIDAKRKLLLAIMQDNGIERIRTSPWFTIQVQKGRERIDTFNEEIIPKDYFRRQEFYTINKELIKEDINKGIDVPGAKIIKENKIIIK